ncbi:MAG: DUF4124 domain-containing protein [Pseudomonadota bacterium]
MKKLIYIAAFSALICNVILNNTVSSKLYKWIDKDGNVQYSSHPPKDGEFKEFDDKSENTLSNDKPYKPQEAPLTEDKTALDRFKKANQQNCTAAQRNKQVLSSSNSVRGIDGNLLSDKQKKEQLRVANEQVKIYCSDDEEN